MKQQTKLVLNIILLCVIGIIIFVIMKNSLGDVFSQLRETKLKVLLTVSGLGSLFLVLESVNYLGLIQPFNKKMSFSTSFFIYCTSSFYRVITFGAGTVVAEMMYFRKQGLSTSQSMGISSAHMMLYKLGVLILSSLALLVSLPVLYAQGIYVIVLVIAGIVVTSLVVLFLFLVSSNQRFHHWLLALADKFLTNDRWNEGLSRFNEQVNSLRGTVEVIMLDKLNVLKLVGLNVLKLIPWYVMPYVIFKEEHQLSLVLVFSLVAMASVLAGIIPSPAGIGSFDFIFVLVFTPLVGKVDAASGLLLYRFGTYLLPVVLGLLYTAKSKRLVLVEEINELKETK